MKKLFFTIVAISFAGSTMMGQCFPDRHNSTWYDGWISCLEAPSPNPLRDTGHWILYDLSQPFEMYEMDVWNTNAPDLLDYGMQDVIIDLSSDSINWVEHGQFTFNQGTGVNNYQGFEALDFDSVVARYVLITAVTNYGGPCYGISEIRINANDICPGNKVKWIGGTGLWNDPLNWCAHKVPTKNDRVIIPGGAHVTVPFGYQANVWTLSLQPAAKLVLIGDLKAHRRTNVISDVDPDLPYEDDP